MIEDPSLRELKLEDNIKETATAYSLEVTATLMPSVRNSCVPARATVPIAMLV